MSEVLRHAYKALLPYEARLWFYKLRHMKKYEQLRSSVHHSPKGDFSIRPFDEHQCIFIHVTKTAGTSVALSLFGFLPYHYTAIDYRVIYGRKTFNNYFKFAFARNPWDRLYSAYRYLMSGGWNEDDRTWANTNIAGFDSFIDFVKHWLTAENIRKHRHFWPQHMFVCDARNRLLVDYLAYFETIEDDFTRICSVLNIDSELGRHNINPGNSYRGAYDDDSRDIVAEVYSTDIQLLGYDFDGIYKRTTVIRP